MIFVILLLGLGLRLISLNQSFWIDEATSASTIHMNLNQFFGKFIIGDFHPPLYYLTLRFWSLFFGTSEIGLRSLSILFGLLAIYFVYLIGKELISKEAGIVSAIFLATSGLFIYYSQEARMYAMSTFLVTFAIFSFVKILKTDKQSLLLRDRVDYWLIFAITIGLIGATDYLPLLILPIFFITGILLKKKTNWFYKLIMSHIILVILALRWLPTFLKQLTSGLSVTNGSPAWVNVLGKFSLKDILLIPVKFAIGRVGFDNKFIYGFFIFLIATIFIYLFYKAKKTVLIWLWLILPIAIALIISVKVPVLNYFRFLFVLPAFYLILASGIVNLDKRVSGIFITAVISINLATSFMYLANVKFQREDWRGAVTFINQNRGENSEILFPALSQMEAFKYYDPNAVLYGGLDEINNNDSEIWLVRYAQPISDPNDLTKIAVEKAGYVKTNEYDFNGVTVWKYSTMPIYASRY